MGKVLFLENQVLLIVLLSEEFVFSIFTFGIFLLCAFETEHYRLSCMESSVVIFG